MDAHHSEQGQVTGSAAKSYRRIDDGDDEKTGCKDEKISIHQLKVALIVNVEVAYPPIVDIDSYTG